MSKDQGGTHRRRPRAAAQEYAEVANHGVRRRLAIAAGALARRLVGGDGPTQTLLPHALSNRLLRFAGHSRGRVVVYSGAPPTTECRSRALLVSHDLSASGAPKMVFEIAQILRAAEHDVIVVAPEDGPFRAALTEIGATVICDRYALSPDPSATSAMAELCHFAICNTALAAWVIGPLARKLPTFWYIHESSLIRDMLASDPAFEEALRSAHEVWAGSEISASLVRAMRPDVVVFPYGLDPIPSSPGRFEGSERLNCAVFGSIEPRKGQDLAVDAMRLLPPDLREKISLTLWGRVIDPEFSAALSRAIGDDPAIRLGGELKPAEYRAKLLGADAVLVSSRDDTLPLVSLDALGAGRVLMCTATTGTSAYLQDGVNGFVAAEATAPAIAATLSRALQLRDRWPAIAAKGEALFARTFSKAAFAERLQASIGKTVRAVRDAAA